MKLTFQSILQTLLWTVICGMLYPAVMTVAFQLLFPKQAQGSLVMHNGQLVGSEFISQQFTGDSYFWSRPSAGSYATVPSGASNLGPTSASLQTNVQTNAKALRDANHLAADAPVPADLVYTSASGVDPDISPEAAYFQVARIAKARGLSEVTVTALVDSFKKGPQWGFLGEPRVNVLLLNLALDDAPPKAAAPAAPAAK
jgi:K+-transporting ATPase ATPase C chain